MPYDIGYDPSNADDKPGTDCFFPWSHPCWSCTDWITWHRALKAKYGDQKAHDTWTNAWKDINGFIDPKGWYCKYDTEFWTYVKANQLDASNFIADVLQEVTTSVSSAANAVSNLVGGGEKLTEVLKWAIPILGVLAIGGLTYAVIKSGSNAVEKKTGPGAATKKAGRSENGKFKKAA